MNEELIAEAMMGRDAEEFISSDLGRFLVGRAEQEVQDAVNELKTVWPWRKRKIQQLQNQIYRAESFQSWLGELVIRGRQALQQLEDAEE